MKFSLLYTIAFAATAMAGTIGTADSYTEREVARALAEATENELLGRQSCNYNQVCTNHASCGSGVSPSLVVVVATCD